LPVLDRISADYGDRVVFLAVGGLGDREATIERGREWLPSGRILWGVDDDAVLWTLFGARGTPTVALITGDDRIVGAWAGAVGEEELRRRIEYLIEVDGGAASAGGADLSDSGEQSPVP
jgi:hypothetical protein